MENHYLGQKQGSGGASSARGSSLAVRQFADAAFGWVPVHAPTSPFRVEAVESEERYCLGCYGVRHFDVVRGAGREIAFCRCCGAEVQRGSD